MATAARSVQVKPTRRLRRQRVDEATKLARLLLPDGQALPGAFGAVDIANHSDVDQRTMVRSKETRTIKRKTHIERLLSAKALTTDQAAICEWYARQHELGYQTVGCTANYGGAGGGTFGSSDLLARYQAQMQARLKYQAARSALPTHLVHLFERIVLHGHGLAAADGGRATSSRYSRLRISFRRACDSLSEIFAENAD